MNAAQITHIFWKEYRTQRVLWLAVVLLFLATAVVTVLFLPQPNQPDVSSLLFSGVFTVGFYVLVSTAILYASEREQQTDVLLRVLPVNPWLMLGVKSAWVVLSSLAAIGIFSAAAFLLTEPSQVTEDGLGFVVWVLSYIFCCTLVASLVTRHVFSAMGIGVFLAVAFPLLARLVFPTDRGWFVYFAIVTPSLFLTSLQLNRRWFRESKWSWRTGIRIGRAMTLQSALALPLEVEGSGRIWRRYLWREWHSASRWFVGILLFAPALMSLFFQGVKGPQEHQFYIFVLSLVLTPFLFGVGSCSADQAQDGYRILGNRGASSFRILLAKHTIWIGTGLVLIVLFQLFFWSDRLKFASFWLEELSAGLRFVPIDLDLLSSARAQQLGSSTIPGIQFCAGVALLLYSLGHFCSLLIRQPALSLAVAFFSSIFATFLVCILYVLDVPLFVLTVAPAICLLALSFYRGKDWIIGDRSAASWGRLALWSLFGLWTLISLLAAWRVAEISFSTVIDLDGLYNIPVYYVVNCAVGVLATLLVLLLADSLRRNFRDASSGRLLFGTRRWCTLGGVIGTFLLGHNLLLLGYFFTVDSTLSLSAEPLRDQVLTEVAESEYQKLDVYNSAVGQMTPFPIPESLQASAGTTAAKNQLLAYQAWNSWDDVTAEQRAWLRKHEHLVAKFFEADRNGFVRKTLYDGVPPEELEQYQQTAGHENQPESFLSANVNKILLVRLQALKLEDEGKLGEAWEHHLAVVRYARRFADDNFPNAREEALRWLSTVMFDGDLWRWQARKEQTSELLAAAAEGVYNELTQLSRLAEAYELQGGWALQTVDNLSTFRLIAGSELLAALPWERQRLRSLIVQQTLFDSQLASQVDRGSVDFSHGNRNSEAGNQVDYSFQSRVPGFPSNWPIILTSDPPGFWLPVPIVVARFHQNTVSSDSSVLPLPIPAAKTETTPLLDHALAKASVLRSVINPAAGSLLVELKLWKSVSDWLGACPVYSYRAETGQFPYDLGQLRQASRTRQLFEPLARLWFEFTRNSVIPADSRIGQAGSFVRQVSSAIVDERDTDNTFLAFGVFGPIYEWHHAEKWMQSEYNFGETPDLKPPVPLRAPLPTPAPEEVLP